jgi:hypothetical protein
MDRAGDEAIAAAAAEANPKEVYYDVIERLCDPACSPARIPSLLATLQTGERVAL